MATSGPYFYQDKHAQPSPQRPATVSDWLAEPEEKGAELIGGRISYKALPSLRHARIQRRLGEVLGPFDRRPGDADRPGGWWIGSEPDILLDGDGVRPDMAGWRRSRVPKEPVAGSQGAITDAPDWVAEILSPTNPARDLIEKMAIYHGASIHHYWILDPTHRLLFVYRHSPDGYILVLSARAGMTVRAEPFDALELSVGFLFGDDDEPPAQDTQQP